MAFNAAQMFAALLADREISRQSDAEKAITRYLVEHMEAQLLPIIEQPLTLETFAHAKLLTAGLFRRPEYERMVDDLIVSMCAQTTAAERQRAFRTSIAQGCSTFENAVANIRAGRVQSDITALRLQNLLRSMCAADPAIATMTVGAFAQAHPKLLL